MQGEIALFTEYCPWVEASQPASQQACKQACKQAVSYLQGPKGSTEIRNTCMIDCHGRYNTPVNPALDRIAVPQVSKCGDGIFVVMIGNFACR